MSSTFGGKIFLRVKQKVVFIYLSFNALTISLKCLLESMASDVKFDVILSLATRSVRLNPPALPPPLWLDSCKISSWSLFPVVLVCIPKYRFWGQLSYLVVFLDGSVGKESTCNAEDAMTQFNP